jgi:hypothetical protein
VGSRVGGIGKILVGARTGVLVLVEVGGDTVAAVVVVEVGAAVSVAVLLAVGLGSAVAVLVAVGNITVWVASACRVGGLRVTAGVGSAAQEIVRIANRTSEHKKPARQIIPSIVHFLFLGLIRKE